MANSQDPIMAPPARRKKYEAGFKLKVVNFAMEHNNCAAARQYGVTEKMVRDRKANEKALKSMPRAEIKLYMMMKSLKKCGISNSLDGMEDDYLWQDEEKAEAETTPSDTELDPYDDCLINVSQDVIDLLMISDDEQEDFEGF
ncbi:hypothetical protein NDU88_003613 [Pleurodeles waltl]|uniref:Brinker DNA-binding domain-containing protein n=1 Tax=Pleurodeles waltl TaxID=8319 RepID=A0AAV7KXX5_PLEWA|nr:hypothetical protein NDU88_003613 [Pleurodeles waltl]